MISENEFLEMLEDGGSHRKQFSYHTGVQKNKSNPTFSVPFDNGLCRHFHDGTGRQLKWNGKHQQFYCFLRTKADIETAENWQASQGTRVFLRNLLDSTTALDTNFVDNSSGARTNSGQLEALAKHDTDKTSISILGSEMVKTVNAISYLSEASGILAVPPSPEKGFDLPTVLALNVAQQTGKDDLTNSYSFIGDKQSVKELSVENKWAGWASSCLTFKKEDVQGESVILIDDKYQSGATMHYVASRLYAAGAKEVHGLVAVKTLRDTDNDDVVES